jgi:hypothetical protein
MGSAPTAHATSASSADEQMKPDNSEIPREYARWLPLLDRFRGGDDSVLELMRNGSIEWSSIVAERWTRHLSSALEGRLTMVSTQLQVALDRSKGENFAIAGALLNARRSLDRLREFAAVPCVPGNVKNHLNGEIDRWARETQSVLEKNAAKIRTDNGRLLKTFRDNPLTAVATGAPPQPTTSSDMELPQRGRRVILK